MKTNKQYLAQLVDFGGETTTVAGVYQWFHDQGLPQIGADYWLMGYFHK